MALTAEKVEDLTDKGFIDLFKQHEALWETKIDVKGDLCVFDSSHPSGHFRRIVWKKRVGLVQYDSGYGAAKDGYKLKRVNTKG